MDRRALTSRLGLDEAAPRRRGAELGLTLVELLIVLALLGIIAALGVPALLQELERFRIRRAILDLEAIEFDIHRYEDAMEGLPEDLDALDSPPRRDPWGRPYVYFKFGGHGWKGQARKDRFLVPINSSFDLYSLGRDGESRPPLQNPRSLDDVIRANDGGFYGLGRDF